MRVAVPYCCCVDDVELFGEAEAKKESLKILEKM
jgi:hypothetical protein